MTIRYVAIGRCPSCNKEFVRHWECTHAACSCQSTSAIPLHPAVILPNKLHKKFSRIADLAGTDVEKLVNAVLLEAAEAILKKYKVKK